MSTDEATGYIVKRWSSGFFEGRHDASEGLWLLLAVPNSWASEWDACLKTRWAGGGA